LVIVIISVFFVVNGLYSYIYRKSFQSIIKLLTTIFIWGSVGIVAFNPNIAYWISSKLGFGENLNTLIFVTFIIIFTIIFRIIKLIEKIAKDIRKITREIALKKLKNEN